LKINRQEIYNKCNGHCAYCGKEITIKQMQIDHIEPHWHTMTKEEAQRFNIKKGSHEMNNLNPSCARCNKWKSTYSLEQFRGVVQRSIDRMERDTPNFRLAKDYGLITITNQPVVFYFERGVKTPNESILKV
jgi:5-methylcytosine-specific restriction endonuclease McrA